MVATGPHEIVLAAEAVSKSFGGVKALDGARLEVWAGKVNALMGENGAGKSTLMKVLAGVYQDYEGRILLNGQPVAFAGPRQAQERGVAMIHQELNLIPGLSIAENIFLGREFVGALGLIDFKVMVCEAARLLDRLDLKVDPRTPVGRLRVGQQQIVEIAKAMACDARVIIMDEPTSAISGREVDVLFGLIRTLTEQGVGVVYISHKMDEVFRISDRITVMRDGRTVHAGNCCEVSQDDVVRMMVGRDVKEFFVSSGADVGAEVLRVETMSLPHPDRPGDYLVRDVSFSVARGEVLGLFGLMGAGRSELFETIFGLHAATASGRVFLEGRPLVAKSARASSAAEAIAAGLGLVPEDRKRQGLVMEMSVAENMTLASLHTVERLGFLSNRLERVMAGDYVRRLAIRTASHRQPVRHLSGGNQQKVVLAKWLATQPKVLFLDEPTRGVDVNAKNQIYELIHELAAAGLAIVMISSELPEIMAIAGRIIVLSEGRQTAEFSRDQATEERLLRAALPGSLSGGERTRMSQRGEFS
jgi:ribose transport system ATP-binding protein